MIERDAVALKAGQDRVADTLTASMKRGLISADKRMALLGMCLSPAALSAATLTDVGSGDRGRVRGLRH